MPFIDVPCSKCKCIFSYHSENKVHDICRQCYTKENGECITRECLTCSIHFKTRFPTNRNCMKCFKEWVSTQPPKDSTDSALHKILENTIFGQVLDDEDQNEITGGHSIM